MKFFFLLLFATVGFSGVFAQAPAADGANTQQVVLSKDVEGPVVLLDGQEISQGELAALDDSQIGDIQILSGAEAMSRYGKYESHGAIVVTSAVAQTSSRGSRETEVVVPGEQVQTSDTASEVKMALPADSNAYVLIDGKPSSMQALQALSPEAILQMNVIKGSDAIEKYGEVASDGAIEVTTRQ